MTGHLLGGAGAVESVAADPGPARPASRRRRSTWRTPTTTRASRSRRSRSSSRHAPTARWPSSTTRSVSAAPTSPSPSPEPEPLSSLPSVPSVPPEQDAPVPPEEIDVTIVDSRTPTHVRPHAGNGGRVAVATAPAAPAPGAAATGRQRRRRHRRRPGATGPRRDPQSRLEALFDPGTLELLLPADDSGMLAGTGSIDGIATVAFASDPRVPGRRHGHRRLPGDRRRLRPRASRSARRSSACGTPAAPGSWRASRACTPSAWCSPP